MIKISNLLMTKENAHLYLPLMQAVAEGKTIEILVNRKGCEDWEEVVDFSFFCSCAPDCYRIKPEPVTTPLGPEDVPPGSALRLTSGSEWFLISRASKFGLYFGSLWVDYIELQGSWQIKRPGEDWKPCHKPA